MLREIELIFKMLRVIELIFKMLRVIELIFKMFFRFNYPFKEETLRY